MLQSIRDRTHGWIAGVIISILILSFALWGIHSYLMGSGAGNSTVAKVNGIEITKNQLTVAYERLRRQQQMQNSDFSLTAAAEINLKQQALESLIKIQVLRQASIAQGFRVTDKQTEYYLESMPQFQVNGQFSIERFQQLLATTLFSPNDFLNLIQTNLLIEQPRLGIIFTSFSLPNEVNDAIALVNQERDIDYAIIPITNNMDLIPADKIESYYSQYRNQFKTPEQVSIEYIELSMKDLMKTINTTDNALKTFYNENINTFTLPKQWNIESIIFPLKDNLSQKEIDEIQQKAVAVITELEKGKSFNQIQLPSNIIKNPKLQGWVTLNQVPSEIQKYLQESSIKSKAVLTPIRLADGIAVINVTNYKEAVTQPFESVRDKVKEIYTRQQAEEKFADQKEKLANLTYENPNSLSEAANALGLEIKTSSIFSKDKGGNDISSNPKVRETAFNNDVLSRQNNSDVLQINSDSALVLRIKTHTPAKLLALENVKNQVIEKLRAEQAIKNAEKLALEIKNKLENNSSLEQIGSQYHINWIRTGYINRHSTKVDNAILDTAFIIPPAQNNKNKTYAVAKVSSGYAVIVLNAIKKGKIDQAAQSEAFGEQIQNAQGLQEYELYKVSLLSKSKISIENLDKEDSVSKSIPSDL